VTQLSPSANNRNQNAMTKRNLVSARMQPQTKSPPMLRRLVPGRQDRPETTLPRTSPAPTYSLAAWEPGVMLGPRFGQIPSSWKKSRGALAPSVSPILIGANRDDNRSADVRRKRGRPRRRPTDDRRRSFYCYLSERAPHKGNRESYYHRYPNHLALPSGMSDGRTTYVR
jgi:hypothetical protein